MPKRKFGDRASNEQDSDDSISQFADDSGSNDSDAILYEKSVQRPDKTRRSLDSERKKKGVEIVTTLVKLSKIYADKCKLQKSKNDITVDLNNIKYFTGGQLKPHQVVGVNWLLTNMRIGVNGILADEMGLGKTIQVIAFLCHLFEEKVKGPHLITVPFSTVPNWIDEFKRFAPELPVVYIPGRRDEKISELPKLNKLYKLGDMQTYPIVITGHKTVPKETLLHTIKWKYIVVDEAQMIKNHESLLGQCLRQLNCQNKILLTGTPLQNNMKELWSLLNFIMPKVFSSVNVCQSLLLLQDMEDNNIKSDADNNNAMVTKIHEALGPFMLRRLKTDVLKDLPPKKEVNVYCPLTKLQRELYNVILKETERLMQTNGTLEVDIELDRSKRKCRNKFNENDLNFINVVPEKKVFITEAEIQLEQMTALIKKKKMTNPLMGLHQIINHPYIISEPILIANEEIVNISGKMMVLDKLLFKLKERGHRVLIFSTFKTIVEILEYYAEFRGYKYKTIHGETTLEERKDNIQDFNRNDDIFLFLMTTRAGGLGLNLSAADTVIIFNQDWNPQCDLQAMDRCHRIGQLKPVVVYTLIAKNTIDEKILDMGIRKKRLGNMVLNNNKLHKFNITDILRESESQHKIYTNDIVPSDAELDVLLDRSDLIMPIKV